MFKMKNLLTLFFIGVVVSSCKKEIAIADYAVIPLPQSITKVEGTPFLLDKSTVIVYPVESEELKKTAEFLSDYLELSTDMKLKTSTEEPAKNAIILRADYANDNNEAYALTVSEDKVMIDGASEAAVFYGMQTLRKSIPADSDGKNIELPAVEIADYPRFVYRGAMLDVSRHFFSVDFVKKYIDILALHNINRFHWHLSDDQGWRIEIKKYPKLIEIGSQRHETVLGRNSGEYDGTPHGGFYTQEQAREIVAYAAERYITVIPEIDLPGHMLAALASYPELGCTGGPYRVAREWGIFDDVLCMGNDQTFEFLEGVFDELTEIFPSKYIHIGGDECPKVRWKSCPKCQARIKSLGLRGDNKHTAEEKLQSYCISRIEKFLNSKGRDIIGWDEILEGGIAPNATVMSWRGMNGGIAAAKMGHDVIMTPNTHLYFDYYQTDRLEDEPIGIGGYIPVKKVYNLEPVPPVLTEDEKKHIIGVQSNLWTEYIIDTIRAEYQLLPRLAALSEVQWLEADKKDYKDFGKRMVNMLKHYDKLEYYYARHIYDIERNIVSNAQKSVVEIGLSTFDDAPIYYTLDGSIPDETCTLYTEPIEISYTSTLRAFAVRDKKKNDVVYNETFTISKSTFKKIVADDNPNKSYTYNGISALVDGLKGGDTYNDSKWIGFNNNQKIAFTIDLGMVMDISNVKVGTFVSTGDWIFGAVGMNIELSEDDRKYKEVIRQSYFEYPQGKPGGRVNLEGAFSTQKVRYVKVVIARTRVIPNWHQGKGQIPFIFMDEIEVN